MQVVIDIDEDVFTRLFDNGTEDYAIANDDVFAIAKSIRNGTPLPKGYGNSSWVPITYREMTQEEKNEFTLDGTEILNCPLPDDGEEVLITTKFRNVYMDVFHNENGDCFFEYYEIEDAMAWMPLPQPYKAESEKGDI